MLYSCTHMVTVGVKGLTDYKYVFHIYDNELSGHQRVNCPVGHRTLCIDGVKCCQVRFWSQHISFWLVGIIIVTSIRGLLITLTKVLRVVCR